jgi:mono/diheme cytochrome c family protein
VKKAIAIVALGVALVRGQQTPPPAGTYAKEQAEAGKAAYQMNCEGCHRSDFQGDQDAKPLAGSAFLNAWRGKTSSDLFTRINKTMPPDTPGSAGEEDNLNIVAFLLQANHVPAGTTPLTYESAVPIPATTPPFDGR